MSLPSFRIFVSSPGDVTEERALAQRVIRRLADEYSSVAKIEGIFWEHEPLAATSTFQAQLARPSQSDVAVCILWARLGTRLPIEFKRADGSPYESGTAFEFEDAAEGFRANGSPALLVYRKTVEATVSLKDEETVLEMLKQRRALQQYLNRWFHNQTDGSLAAAFHPFESPPRFEELLDQHLRKLIDRRWPLSAGEGSRGLWRERTPFRGLSLFDVEHAPIFFGRSRATAEVLASLRARATEGEAFVLVLGMSGSGKSSLARAGVLPLLIQPGVMSSATAWTPIVMRPTQAGTGRGAIHALAEAWLSAHGRNVREADELSAQLRTTPDRAAEILLSLSPLEEVTVHVALVVDQLEEIFTQADSTAADRIAFIAILRALAVSGRVWVVGTMRSDFYARCAELPQLVRLMEGRGQYYLLPPSPAELTQVIRLPARMAALRLEEDAQTGERLEDLLLTATIGNPGSLPLLEFTLEELYKRRRPDGLLSLESYRSLGGVEGALATRAEEVYSALDEGAREQLPIVLRALVYVDPARGDVALRRSARLDGFTSAETQGLVQAFIDARLFTADRAESGHATVSVAHEALLRHWPLVQTWLQEDREYLQVRARVEAAATLWRTEQESPLFLLRAGKALGDAVEMVSRSRDDFDGALVRFVESSRRAARRVRLVRLGLQGAAVIMLLVFALSSYLQWQGSERNRLEAKAQRDQLLKQSEIFLPNALELEFPGDTLRPDQKRMLHLLLSELRAADFRGALYLQGHLGRFQVVRDGSLQALRMRSARDRCTPAARCEFYPPPAGAERALAHVQRSLEQLADSLAIDGIDVRIASLPMEQALEPYPDSAKVAAWNAAARRNHRVEVRLVPAESQIVP